MPFEVAGIAIGDEEKTGHDSFSASPVPLQIPTAGPPPLLHPISTDPLNLSSPSTVDRAFLSPIKADSAAPLSPSAVSSSPRSSDDPSLSKNAAATKYLELQHRLRQHWTDCPDLYIHYTDLRYTLSVPVVEVSTPSFLRAGAQGIINLVKRLDVTATLRKADRTVDLLALAPCTGRIAPGKMTLILAPPGHGKSTLLKALAGRLSRDPKLGGEVLYNGLAPAELHARGLVLSKLVSYVGQTDLHFPVLTVRETLAFAAENSCASVERWGDAELRAMEKERADRLIHMVGLEEAANTIIGNDLLRGVSGGQRKRVTIGEMLITNARVHCLDEVSTGLDSAITFHIFNALRSYCHECHNSVVTALLQPTPETYGLFDDVILMRDGEVVYHGERANVKRWFAEGLGCPIPDEEDEAGFIVDYLTNPQLLLDTLRRKEQRRVQQLARREASQTGKKLVEAEDEKALSDSHYEQPPVASVTAPPAADGDEDDSMEPKYVTNASAVVETVEMLSRFRASRDYAELMTTAQAGRKMIETEPRFALQPSQWSAYSRDQYARPFPHSWAHHFHMAVTRQSKLFWRNKQVLAPRLFQAVLMGIVYGTLFYKLALSDFSSKMGLLLYLVMFGAFANLSELPVAAEARAVVTKQLDASFYPSIPYIFSVIFLGLPLAIVETLIFGSMMYCRIAPLPRISSHLSIASLTHWLCCAVPGTGCRASRRRPGASSSFSSSSSSARWPCPHSSAPSHTGTRSCSPTHPVSHPLLRCLTSPSPSSLPLSPCAVLPIPMWRVKWTSPSSSSSSSSAASSSPYDEIPHWLIWVFWISPLSWGVRSLAQNEFFSSRYDYPESSSNPERAGDYYLEQFDVSLNSQYKWAGVGYLLGFFLTFALVSSVAITYIRAGGQLGTKRLPPVDPKTASAAGLQVADGTVVNSQGNPVQPAQTASVASGTGSVGTALASTVGAPMGAALSETDCAVGRDPLTVQPQVGAHMSVPISVAPKKLSSRGQSSFQMGGMPFTPVTLTWRDIHYYVDVKGRGKEKVTKHLLKGINGFSRPGTLTALMGSSGAGKTTLMDVIAGRKTMGRITGDILVNGRPKDTASFNHLTGYVEQQDLHMGLHTVREALDFSANIRLPASVPETQRTKWVEEVMSLVGLTRIGHRIIGDAASPGLSPGQMKLVTIAVELVANPSVLFLDEPTSGLDAPSAFRIMKAVSRIAQTGRSVLCTIHQPSAELFFMFNRLLLLRSGGQEVYFGDIGSHGHLLVEYFETSSKSSCPPQLPLGQNPANWMLDVIGAGVHSEEGGAIAALDYEAADWHAIWQESQLRKDAARETEFLSKPGNAGEDAMAIVVAQPYINELQRYLHVQKRYFVMHYRNAPTNLSRIILMLINGLLLGLIYLKIDKTSFAGVNSFLAVIFLGISFPASVSSASAFPSFFRQRAVYYRESTIGMYHFFTYSTAMTVVELPYIFIALAFFIVPFYFMVGFVSSGTLFWKFYLVVYVQALVYSFLSQFWMALCPSQISSNIINGLFMSLFFMFGGLFIKASKMPTGWKWVRGAHTSHAHSPQLHPLCTSTHLHCAFSRLDAVLLYRPCSQDVHRRLAAAVLWPVRLPGARQRLRADHVHGRRRQLADGLHLRVRPRPHRRLSDRVLADDWLAAAHYARHPRTQPPRTALHLAHQEVRGGGGLLGPRLVFPATSASGTRAVRFKGGTVDCCRFCPLPRLVLSCPPRPLRFSFLCCPVNLVRVPAEKRSSRSSFRGHRYPPLTALTAIVAPAPLPLLSEPSALLSFSATRLSPSFPRTSPSPAIDNVRCSGGVTIRRCRAQRVAAPSKRVRGGAV